MTMIDFSNYPRFKELNQKKILAVDYGLKVVGTAYYTPGVDPFPIMFEKIIYQSDLQIIAALQSFISDECIDILVIGVPYFLDGKESDQTKLVKDFIELVRSKITDIEIFEQDETLTTDAAKTRMLNSAEFNFKIDLKKIDCLSAVIILEDFMRVID